MNQQLEQDLERLRSWAQTLVNRIQSTTPSIKNIFDGDRPLPEGCPSKESLASMQFNEVRAAFQEVESALKDIDQHF